MDSSMIDMLKYNWPDISVLWYEEDDDEYVDPYPEGQPSWSCITCASFLKFINDCDKEPELYKNDATFDIGYIYEFVSYVTPHHFTLIILDDRNALYIDYFEELRPKHPLLIKKIQICDVQLILNFLMGKDDKGFTLKFYEKEVYDELELADELYYCKYINKHPTAKYVANKLLDRTRFKKDKTKLFQSALKNMRTILYK